MSDQLKRVADNMVEDFVALMRAKEKGMQQKYKAMMREDFLERARNADVILENCRKSLARQ